MHGIREKARWKENNTNIYMMIREDIDKIQGNDILKYNRIQFDEAMLHPVEYGSQGGVYGLSEATVSWEILRPNADNRTCAG
jgi:hypothetical protein